MKRNLILWVAMAMGVMGGVGAQADQLRIDLVMRDYHVSRNDAAAIAMVSAAFSFGERDVVYWARDCGRPVRDVGPAYVIAYYTHRPVYDVWRGRHGRDWYDYGEDCGMDWGRFNRLGISYGDFNRMIWLNMSNSAYGCDNYMWDDLYDQGLSFTDVIVTIVLGDGHRDRCDYYAYEYRHHDRDWDRMWSSGRRDPRFWSGYRDWDRRRDGDYRYDRSSRDRDRQLQDERDRRLRDDRSNRDRNRQLQDERDRRERNLELQQERDRADRERRLRDDRNRSQDRDRSLRDDQQRRDRDRQIQDDRNRSRDRDRSAGGGDRRSNDSRDNGRRDRGGNSGRSDDRSKRDNSGRDRGDSGGRGR